MISYDISWYDKPVYHMMWHDMIWFDDRQATGYASLIHNFNKTSFWYLILFSTLDEDDCSDFDDSDEEETKMDCGRYSTQLNGYAKY